MERINDLKVGEKISFEIECVEKENVNPDEPCEGCFFNDDCPDFIRCNFIDRADGRNVVFNGKILERITES